MCLIRNCNPRWILDVTNPEVFILFIYYSLVKKKALIESTMFQKKFKVKAFIKPRISNYLKKHFNLTSFTTSHYEEGVIPMHQISIKSQYSLSIGTRGGAVRPSSGWCIYFIQKTSISNF